MFTPGDALGRYELLAPIAKGGMAQVWAARLRTTRGFQKVVAIKTILAAALDDVRMEQMFLQEAKLAAQVHHPNVVETLELGEQDGRLYLVMEWVHGEALRLVLHESRKRGGVPLNVGVNLAGQVCRGLHAAHEARDVEGRPLGIVHRDVSPHNVLVSYQGVAKLVDFGVAKARLGHEELTERGELKGKLAFMSPEQARGEPLDARSDIFSLGSILYWMTAGRHPFQGDTPKATRENLLRGELPPPPSRFAPGGSVALDLVVLRALAFRVDDRWESARDFLEALGQAAPRAFESDAEVGVAAYMAGLFGARAEARLEQLRVAQQVVDRMNPGLQTSGSLPAVAVSGRGSAPLGHRAVVAVDRRPSPSSFGPLARVGIRPVLAGAALVAALGVVVGFSVRGVGVDTQSAAGGPPGPRAEALELPSEAGATTLGVSPMAPGPPAAPGDESGELEVARVPKEGAAGPAPSEPDGEHPPSLAGDESPGRALEEQTDRRERPARGGKKAARRRPRTVTARTKARAETPRASKRNSAAPEPPIDAWNLDDYGGRQ